MRWSVALASLLLAGGAAAGEIDWPAVAASDVVRVVTTDPDGDVRETRVWIVADGGAAWLRTGDSRWLANIRRDPDVRLRVGERVFELRAEEVTDPAARQRVAAAMRAKYGWSDRMVAIFRPRTPHILRLVPRNP